MRELVDVHNTQKPTTTIQSNAIYTCSHHDTPQPAIQARTHNSGHGKHASFHHHHWRTIEDEQQHDASFSAGHDDASARHQAHTFEYQNGDGVYYGLASSKRNDTQTHARLDDTDGDGGVSHSRCGLISLPVSGLA